MFLPAEGPLWLTRISGTFVLAEKTSAFTDQQLDPQLIRTATSQFLASSREEISLTERKKGLGAFRKYSRVPMTYPAELGL